MAAWTSVYRSKDPVLVRLVEDGLRGAVLAPRRFVLPRVEGVAIIFFVAMEIITSSSVRTFLLLGLSSVAANLAPAAEIVLQKVPPLTVEQAPAYPENLARYEAGAQMEAAPKSASALQLSSKSEDHNTAEAALLCGDPTVGYALNSGTTTLLISLPKVENIDNVSFLNNGAKGQLTIAISNAKLPADSPQWNTIAQQDLTGETVKAKVGPSEAKYVRLTFNVSDAGRIADLGIYSTPTVAAFANPRAPKVAPAQSDNVALIAYNLTDLHAKARAVYVSSGDDPKQANNMLDDQPSTVYNFSGPDAQPTAIVDLGKVTKLRRISALYSPGRGTLEFYVLQSLPGAAQGASAKTFQLDSSAMAGLRPVGSVTDEGAGRAAVDFPETTGRYIMLKWTPAEPGTPFSVAEVAAFGAEKANNLVAANNHGNNRRRASSDGTVPDGKDFKDLGDNKDMPEEGPPGEGPAPELPDPPPFVFVPVVSPASP
jgi:hypothetical protein